MNSFIKPSSSRAAIVLLSAIFCHAMELPGLCAVQSDRTVILISVDGLSSYYLDDPRADMPAIRRLAEQGARADRMLCSFPTVTWPNHTTLVTGVEPGRHGVIGNSYLDRKTGKVVPFIPDPLFDKDEIVKVPTIYDAAHAAGLKTAGVIWPATRNSKTLDWQLPDVFEQALWDEYGTPSLLEELRAKGIPYHKQEEWCRAGNAGKPLRDWLYTRISRHIITEHKPNLLLLHLVTVDAYEHATGRQTPEAYWACNDSDNRIRDVVEAVESAGLRDRTAVFVVSDHGFITYTNQIKPNVLLRQEELIRVDGSGSETRRAYSLAQGGAAFVYVLDDERRTEILESIRPKLASLQGVAKVITPEDFERLGHRPPSEDEREPDLMLSAKAGYAFSNDASGDRAVQSIGSPRGAHGYLPTHPLMYGTFVAAGDGIKRGARLTEVRSVDVAPTIAALLGVKLKDVEGRVLREILDE